MSTETRCDTMEVPAPFSPKQTTDIKPVMASVEIAYEEGHQDGYQEGHQDGYQEGWENCNREIHDVVAQESYDDGIREGRALAADEIDELRKKIQAQQAEIKVMMQLWERDLERTTPDKRSVWQHIAANLIVN